MRANFVSKNNLNWIEDLDLLVDTLNNRIHDTTKQKPNDLWEASKKKIPDLKEVKNLTTDKLELQNKLVGETLRRVKEQIKRVENQELNVGDFVRIAM